MPLRTNKLTRDDVNKRIREQKEAEAAEQDKAQKKAAKSETTKSESDSKK